jgi:hypothetical protein
MKRIQKKSKNLEIIFATPSEYFEILFQTNVRFKEFHGDLLPLITKDFGRLASWTGFYSQMPHLKQKIVEVERLARATELLQASLHQVPHEAKKLAITAHHDAITGTSRQEVIDDYYRLLVEEHEEIIQILGRTFQNLLNDSKVPSSLSLPYKVLFIFNPLGWAVEKTLSFHSSNEFVFIYSPREKVISQSIPWDDTFKIFFKYRLEAFTLSSIFITEHASECEGCSEASKEKSVTLINSNQLRLTFKDGFLEYVKFKGKLHELYTKLHYYYTGTNGPYTFVPSVKTN